MKKLLVIVAALATAATGYSQGTLGQINFVTYNTTAGSAVNAAATYSGGPAANIKPTSTNQSVLDGALVYGGINARAALYAKAGTGNAAGDLAIITPNVPYYNLGALAGQVNSTAGGGSKTRTVPGSTAGGMATFQIRAWDLGIAPTGNTMTYEDAVAYINQGHNGYLGAGDVRDFALGGGSIATTFLVGYAPYTLNYVPEPSVIGLGILGALAGLFVFRRRN